MKMKSGVFTLWEKMALEILDAYCHDIWRWGKCGTLTHYYVLLFSFFGQFLSFKIYRATVKGQGFQYPAFVHGLNIVPKMYDT